MTTSFLCESERLKDLQNFIKSDLPSARFVHNPLKISTKYLVELSMNVEDGNKLNQWFAKWDIADNPPAKPKQNIFQRFLNYFK